ncbi:MAG: DUF1292 domain-containing protein [Clostridia bacterium]|nr:DUF1292 domain-containing protein [Clostridia bacterium]
MDNEKMNDFDAVDPDNIITLTDENGVEVEFEIIADYEKDGNKYFAMFPPEDEADENSDIVEYVILKLVTDEESGEEFFVSIDDDDELDDIADYFDDLFSSEIDYD